MNATTLPLPAIRFVAIPTSARRIVLAQPAAPARAVAAARPLTLEPFALAATDALEAGRACCPRPRHDNLARYAAPAAPALFHVC